MLRVLPCSLVLVLATSAPTLAQPTAAERLQARELTERAIQQTRKGAHSSAIELYERAYDLSNEAILLSNIGSAYQALREPQKALAHFCLYLEVDPVGKVAAFAREQVKILAAELSLDKPCEKESASAPGTRPPRPAPLPPDDAPDEGEQEESRHESVEEGEPTTAPQAKATARQAPPRLPSVLVGSGVVLGLAGAAALGGAGYYGWVGQNANDVINNNRDGWTQEELEQERIGKEANQRMKILGIAGGAALAAGVTLVIVGRSMRPDERQVALVPTISPQSQGVALVGRFD